jgi:hypothetical protein
MPSTDKMVLAPLIAGFALLVLFGIWETLEKCKYPLCPPRIFRSHYGREFTVPFTVAFIVTMFYYGQSFRICSHLRHLLIIPIEL